MQMKSLGWYIAAIILIIAVLRECGRVGPSEPKVFTRYVYDSAVRAVPLPLPAVLKSTVYKPVPKDVDTAKILREHFSERTYVARIDDGRIRATIVDTVYKNTLIGRSFNYQWLQPVKQETTVVNRRGGFYVGMQVAATMDSLTSVSPSILFIPRKGRWGYSGSYNLLRKKNSPEITFGAYWILIGK